MYFIFLSFMNSRSFACEMNRLYVGLELGQNFMVNLLKLGSMSLRIIESEWFGGGICVNSICLLFFSLRA